MLALATSMLGCFTYDVRHFDVLDRPDPVLVLPSTSPLLAPYVVGEAVTASGCETRSERVDVQQLIDEARGEHDAIVQFTLQRRLRGSCVGYGTRRALERWEPSPFECLGNDVRGHQLRTGAAALSGLRSVGLGGEEVCYEASGRAADFVVPDAVAAAVVVDAAAETPEPEVVAPPVAEGAQAVLTLASSAPPFSGVEVRCPNGFRERAVFVDGVARVPGVPAERCEVFFKGGPPSKTHLNGPMSVTCAFQGVAANCR